MKSVFDDEPCSVSFEQHYEVCQAIKALITGWLRRSCAACTNACATFGPGPDTDLSSATCARHPQGTRGNRPQGRRTIAAARQAAMSAQHTIALHTELQRPNPL